MTIGDYAIIGDCRCAALISKGGAIEWLCLPRFDSPSLFGAMLDARRGGHFTIRPIAPFTVQRRYRGGTNVLDTVFSTPTGKLQLTDLMPVYTREEQRAILCPQRQLPRLARCIEGEVTLEVVYAPRPDYGRRRPRISARGALGYFCSSGRHIYILRSDVALTLSADRASAGGRHHLHTGEECLFAFSFSQGEMGVLPTLGDIARGRIEKTVAWWRQWSDRCEHQGRYRDMVLRSALVLKLMTYSPSGAYIAAPTTSLPEKYGGTRNWDYRFCWLRDTSMLVRALVRIGYLTEAETFLDWMLHSTRLTWPRLQVLYDVYGEARLSETELDHLEGYRGNRPVRIGNEAGGQVQLDVYGAVIEAAAEYYKDGRTLPSAEARMLTGLGKRVCRKWREADYGIWEIRADPRHNTHSKLMCWVALDRLIAMSRKGLLKLDEERFRREREAIRQAIETDGYNEHLRNYVSYFGGDTVDTSLLQLSISSFVRPRDARFRRTFERIVRELEHNGLLFRFPFGFDGIQEGENAFAISNFVAAEHLALAGELEAARRRFEHTLSFANDVGLFAEEIDPESGAAMGNFPQAYTHIGLINAACAIDELENAEQTGTNG